MAESNGHTTEASPSPHHHHPAPPPLPHHAVARDAPPTRTRALSSASRAPLSKSQSPSSQQTRTFQTFDSPPERRPSFSYGHHRKTSIVHGYQHTRDPSHPGPGGSPLSPQVIMASGGKDIPSQTATPTSSLPIVRKSPSASALNGFGMNATLHNDDHSPLNKRLLNRVNSMRTRQEHEILRSPRAQAEEEVDHSFTTVGEYALHHLLTNFIKEADERIERCMSEASEANLNVETICGPGVDLGFDQLIKAIGHIGRDNPKYQIDSVMIWRKGKSESTSKLYDELQAARSLLGSNGSGPNHGHSHSHNTVRRFDSSHIGATNPNSPGADARKISQIENSIRRAERRSAISVYILCRTLMEIMSQCKPGALPDDVSSRLEDVIWAQVRSVDPDALQQSPIRLAQWNIFGQLLGVMSTLRFSPIISRYVAELGAFNRRLSAKGHAERDLERKASLLVEQMRWLRIAVSPEDAWDRSCNYLGVLAGFFASVHGSDIKHAYCQLFEDLLLPIAAKATGQLNSPKWRQVLETLKSKISQLLVKIKHWPQAFPLQVVVLCASPIDVFSQQWLPTCLQLQSKMKDRASRSHALKALCRLVWRYLYRTTDPPAMNTKKLDEIVKMIFQPGRRSLLSTEPSIADPLIQLIRIIGYKSQDFCFRQILFPLMNVDLFMSGKELKIEALEPERMVIAIRAFLAIMTDLEKATPPTFPLTFECDAMLDPYANSPHSHRRSVSTSSVVHPGKIDRLSRPVMTTSFPELTKESYVKFCKILGEITIICDNAFGGQAVLDERIAQSVPKTPMADAFVFGRRDELYSPTDARQSFYDLLYVAVQALPRCLSPHIPFNSLINLLCTGTAHVQSHIASSSAQSLKSIARQSHAQQVTIGFARFIFNFDDRYSTVADGGLLGAQHIESTLKLYVELLEIWIEDLRQSSGVARSPLEPKDEDPLARSATSDLNRSRVFAHVDEIESHGLFFLCSPSRHVRSFAIRVLRLVTKFDSALGQPSTRIISILEGSSQQVIDVNDDKLSIAERSRLQKGLRKSNLNSTLVELCSSDIPHDSALWVKVFPNLIRLGQQICPQAVLLTREIVCARLLHGHTTIGMLAEPTYDNPYQSRVSGRLPFAAPEVTIEQWKLHLIFACTTLTNAGSSHLNAVPNAQHTRKGSKNSSSGNEKIASAAELFAKVVPFLSVTSDRIRAAAAVGLGTINANLYRTLLEALQPLVAHCNEDARSRLASHQRTMSAPRRSQKSDHLRTEITHLYKLTAHWLREPDILSDDWILQTVVGYTKDLRIFLNDAEVQSQWEYQRLRTHFCGLMEMLYEGLRHLKDPSRWMPFSSRKAAFSMMEDWCGHSPNQAQIAQKEDQMRRNVLEQAQDLHLRGGVTAAMEIEKKDLRAAALSAMAALSAGPISIPGEGGTAQQFDMRRMLQWINTIFIETQSDKTHATGRRALKNLITHNKDHGFLLARSIEMCYLAKAPKALSSYFEVVTQVLIESDDKATPFWKVLCACLYTLGNEKSEIRMKSIRLLCKLDERTKQKSKLDDLDISVSDKTTAVYKLAQFQTSQRLANQYSELAFHVFSEFSVYFKELMPDHQRNMVSAMLPWLQTIELQIDGQGQPTTSSYMLLVNLFEITVRSSTALHNEVQALWQALATGPHGGNVQTILDFIIAVCLDRREQNFVEYAKQVVVFLSGTPAGSKVVDFLMLQLKPRSMVSDKDHSLLPPSDSAGLPYMADLSVVLPMGNKQSGLSLCQLSLMLLVDLIVPPIELPKESVPVMLQTIITQWDHYMSLVQDQSREMLVHLVHAHVVSRIEAGSPSSDKRAIEDLIDSIRQQDAKVTWSYEDTGAAITNSQTNGVPESMAYLIDELVKAFSLSYNDDAGFDFRLNWARTTLEWATSCPVRHVACRSFQIFRCVLTNLDKQMLGDMLARLSNTIADNDNDYLTFSQEILVTLHTVIGRLEVIDMIEFPQLFWITCACLDTIFEQEFFESLTMLERLLNKLDLSDPAVIKLFKENQPPSWDGHFEGLQPLVYKGVRSSACIDRTLSILEIMTKLPSSELVGDGSRLLFTTLANLPRFLHAFDEDSSRDPACLQSAETLAVLAELQGHSLLAHTLTEFARESFTSEKHFLESSVHAIKMAFFPSSEFDSMVFLIGLLNNNLPWVKTNTMKLLCLLIPGIDMRKPEFASQGLDLITPILRLLQTGFCQQALEVLDTFMAMSGTRLDGHHMRMSMVGPHSHRSVRKEYASTKSLYGIPEESGWSIPMPAVVSERTRHNVHAVVRTCTPETPGAYENHVGTPKIEFADDQHYQGYFPGDASSRMLGDPARSDGHMNELVMKLDSLDDFFDDQDQSTPQGRESLGMYSASLPDDRDQLYAQQALPILHKTLGRNASVTSFQTGFSDARHGSSREPAIMTPTAFVGDQPLQAPSRPGLHNRSVTSPAAAALPGTPHRWADNLTSGDEAGDEPEPFSDDDFGPLSRTQTSEDPFPTAPYGTSSYATGTGPSGRNGSVSSMRTGLRPGGRRLAQARADPLPPNASASKNSPNLNKAAAFDPQRSPEVPKVPDMWMQEHRSPEQ